MENPQVRSLSQIIGDEALRFRVQQANVPYARKLVELENRKLGIRSVLNKLNSEISYAVLLNETPNDDLISKARNLREEGTQLPLIMNQITDQMRAAMYTQLTEILPPQAMAEIPEAQLHAFYDFLASSSSCKIIALRLLDKAEEYRRRDAEGEL